MPPHTASSTRPTRRAAGVSIAELTTALAVAAVLAAVALPGMAALVARSEADAAVEQLRGAVQFARHSAVATGRVATICPGPQAPAGGCGARDSWHLGGIVFLDADGNGERDAGDEVVLRLPPFATGFRATWRSFRNRKFLSMLPTGTTNWQNGSLLVCPPDADPTAARLLIVNAQGSVRLAADSDGDGIVEAAGGRPVAC